MKLTKIEARWPGSTPLIHSEKRKRLEAPGPMDGFLGEWMVHSFNCPSFKRGDAQLGMCMFKNSPQMSPGSSAVTHFCIQCVCLSVYSVLPSSDPRGPWLLPQDWPLQQTPPPTQRYLNILLIIDVFSDGPDNVLVWWTSAGFGARP